MGYRGIDTSPLYAQLPPSALSQGMGQVGGILEAFMARRREMERQAILDQQKADELQFRRDQENRLIKRQEFMDEREENRLNRQDERETRSALADAATKNGGAALPSIAQIYGGSVRQAQPNYTNENDPLGPEIPMLDNVQEDDSYLGFSYGMNPEHERRTQEAAGKRIVSIPGMQDMELPAPQAAENHFSRLRSYLQSLPPGADQALAMRSLGQSEALGLDPHRTNEALEAARADQRMRDLAAQRAKKGGGTSASQSQKALNQQLLTEGKYDGIVQKVLQNKGYKEINTSEVKFSDMAASIAGAEDSAALAAIGSGQFVKMAQGGVGVISDNDMRVFWQRIGGAEGRARQTFQDYASGKLDSKKRRDVEIALQQLESKAQQNMQGIGASIAARLEGVPGGTEQIPTYLQTYAPGYLPVWQAKRQKPGDKAKALNSEADDLLKGIK